MECVAFLIGELQSLELTRTHCEKRLMNSPLQSVLFVMTFSSASQPSSPQGCCLCWAGGEKVPRQTHLRGRTQAARLHVCFRRTDAPEQMAPRRRSFCLTCACGECTERLVRSSDGDVPRLPEKRRSRPRFRAKDLR